jgi:hypothetical protein
MTNPRCGSSRRAICFGLLAGLKIVGRSGGDSAMSALAERQAATHWHQQPCLPKTLPPATSRPRRKIKRGIDSPSNAP